MKTFVSLWNQASTGKTSTLREVARQLLQRLPQSRIIEPTDGSIPDDTDFVLLIEVNDRHIAVITAGDEWWEIESTLERLLPYDCKLIFGATRSRGRTVDVVSEFQAAHGYDVIWTSTYQCNAALQGTLNVLKAEHILDMVARLGRL